MKYTRVDDKTGREVAGGLFNGCRETLSNTLKEVEAPVCVSFSLVCVGGRGGVVVVVVAPGVPFLLISL